MKLMRRLHFMRLERGLETPHRRYAAARQVVAAVLLALGAACGGSSEETPAAATEGAEAPPAPPAPEPAALPAPPPAPEAAPEPAAPAANTAQPQPQMPTSAALIIHTVKDFDAWKTAFDNHQAARKSAGALGEGVMRGVDNPKQVVVYVPTNDVPKMKEFMASKDLKDAMKTAGVVGKPTVYMFNTAGGKMAPPDKTNLFGAVLEIPTKDFAAFKTAIEAQQPARDAAGILGYGLGQGIDKPNDAYLYLQSDDAAKLKTYLNAKETKAAFKDAGAKGALKPTVVQETSMTMYQQ
jgi:hypothetical protein